MPEIVMPRLTDSMEEGVILSWLKEDGDEVSIGDELVEIETDKASMVYESDLAGALKILVPEGETRPIGEPIAQVGEPTESSEAPVREADTSGEEGAAPAAKPDWGSNHPEPEDRNRIKASPLARRVAEEKGVDLSSLSGSGPGGRIIKSDVEAAGTDVPPPRKDDEKEPSASRDSGGSASRTEGDVDLARGEPEIVELTRTQQVIARRMTESKATIPHFYLRTLIDMDRAVEVRTAFKAEAAEGEVVPSLNDFVVKATAIALRRHPRANAAFHDEHFELYPRVNVGIAVAAEGALIVPVLRDADHLTLTEISSESRRLAERVRSGEVTPPELSGATFTVSNLGMFGVTGFEAVINPGQAGILSVGEVSERAVVREGQLTSAHQMEVTVACDHRILYGADGAEFLASIKANLEEPGLLA
ncbi:MAG: 2-oxo acid dehydrogenase subunit E2 [Solirubrobacterales bacterium]|nr:2-oxo acid dehydrogenase subunit E2 [Solirubrobacterales bacterium]